MFDLQKVLSPPRYETGPVYCKRKLSTCNLTFCDGARRKGKCYFWNETGGKRGANDVSSCMQVFVRVEVEERKTTDFRFWAEHCLGHNENKYVFTMCIFLCLLYGVKITGIFRLDTLTVRMDVMLPIIEENYKKQVPIFTSEQYCDIIANS